MTRLLAFLALFATLCAAPQASRAAEDPDGIVHARDVKTILQIAQSHGSANLTKDDDGDPKITGCINQVCYSVYFYGCVEHANCKSIQFHSGFKMNKDHKPDWRVINEWNKEKRYGRAYKGKDGDPFVEMDIPMDNGTTYGTLDVAFQDWGKVMGKFAKAIDFKF